jgi:hypothetical protein
VISIQWTWGCSSFSKKACSFPFWFTTVFLYSPLFMWTVEELLFAKHINCAFVKLVAQPQFIVGLIKIKLYFLFNQIAISVVLVFHLSSSLIYFFCLITREVWILWNYITSQKMPPDLSAHMALVSEAPQFYLNCFNFVLFCFIFSYYQGTLV